MGLVTYSPNFTMDLFINDITALLSSILSVFNLS